MKTRIGSLKKHTDAELVKLTMAGDEVGYDALMNRHSVKLAVYIYYLVMNATDVEDVMQNTFLSGLLELRKGHYQDQNDFAKWLRGIARHEAYDWLKMKRRETTMMRELKWNLDTGGKKRRTHGIPGGALEWAMLKLSPQMQLIISMHFLKKMSFKEIAAQLFITIGAVTSAYSKALEKLRVVLRPWEWAH